MRERLEAALERCVAASAFRVLWKDAVARDPHLPGFPIPKRLGPNLEPERSKSASGRFCAWIVGVHVIEGARLGHELTVQQSFIIVNVIF